MKKKLLITGVSGLLGGSLAYVLREKYDITGWYHAHKVFIPSVDSYKVDIADPQAVKQFLSGYKPDIVLHCASLTNVDYCEKNKAETKRINVEGTTHIVSACNDPAIKLVYISTDAVHDGKKGQYNEDDPVAPCNYYGLTKYEAEGVVKAHQNHIITRTNIFGWNIQNKQSLAEWILYNLERGVGINGFKDAIFSSIYTLEFARIMDLMFDKDLKGTFNLASRNLISKYKFAVLIAEALNKDKSLVTPISVDDHSFFAKRGKDLSLNTAKLSNALAQDMPSVEECVNSFYKDYKNGVLEDVKSFSGK